jgi:hypothetical protein
VEDPILFDLAGRDRISDASIRQRRVCAADRAEDQNETTA